MIPIRAALLEAPTTERPFAERAPLRLTEIAAEPPGPGEVLVRIRAVSLCRSDLSVITGVRAWPMPIVPGHEASGIVEAVGGPDSAFAPGDQVVLVYQAQCGACPCCLAGDRHLCGPGLAANRAGALLTGGPRLSYDGMPVHHHMGLSAFADFAVVAESSLVRVDGDISAEIAALFGCAVLCGAGSVLNTGRVRPGETVAIAGIGGVGASAILGARLAGAGRILAVDPDPEKREKALELGATDAFDAGPDTAAEILEATGGGVDCALETAGQLAAFEIAYAAAGRGGRVVNVGLVNPATPFPLDLAAHVTSGKRLIGSYMGSCNPPLDIPKLLALHRTGRFPVDRLITARMTLDDINHALDRMADSRELRQILVP